MPQKKQEKEYLEQKNKIVLAFNMKVIQELWKKIKGSLGKNKVRGNEYDIHSLCGSIEKSKQSIYEMINAEKEFEVGKIDIWACRIEKKTGIPKEYLTGKERIKLGSKFEDFYKVYENYIEDCDIINGELKRAKEKPVNYSMAKLKKSREVLKECGKGNYITEVEEALKNMVSFNEALDKEINIIKEVGPVRRVGEDPKLYKLIYFIKYGKKQDAIGIENVQDIMRVMEGIRTAQLKDLGEAGLKAYIEMLEKHLKLAESVYTVAVDCGAFLI